jgi:hypothetical protein
VPDPVKEWLDLVSRNERQIMSVLGKVWQEATGGLKVRELERLYALGNTDAIMAAIDWGAWDRAYAKYLTPELERILEVGARRGVMALPPTLEAAFGVVEPLVAEMARTYGAERIVEVTSAQREAVRVYVAESYLNGTGSGGAARAIRDVVGVTERDALAIARFERAVDEVYEGTRTAASVANQYPTAPAIRGRAEKVKERYRYRTRLRRSERIARTETAKAIHTAQRKLWTDLRDRGVYTNEVLEWITVPDDRRCQICEPMQGQQIDLTIGFTTGGGNIVDMPPAHPNCRCAVRVVLNPQYVRPEILAAAEATA